MNTVIGLLLNPLRYIYEECTPKDLGGVRLVERGVRASLVKSNAFLDVLSSAKLSETQYADF